MIRVECSGCAKKLGVADAAAGKMVTCPACKTKMRVPAAASAPDAPAVPVRKAAPPPPKETELVEPIGDEDEDEEQESRPARKKAAKRRKRIEEDEDSEDEGADDGPWFNANRIRGVVGIVAAIGVLIFALTFEKFKNAGDFEYGQYGTPVGCVLAGLLFVSGVFYLIRG